MAKCVNFTKMSACGNDYIYFDCINDYSFNDFYPHQELAKKLSRRRFSVGSDGVIFICKSDIADAKMVMFNADGSRAVCGNGMRSVAKYLFDTKIVTNSTITLEVDGDIKNISIQQENGKAKTITVNMGTPKFGADEIPVDINLLKELSINKTSIKNFTNSKSSSPIQNLNLNTRDIVFGYTISVLGQKYIINCLSMGNPHCVVFFKEDIDLIDLNKIGPFFEDHQIFPQRTNTEFVQVLERNKLKMRVYERGSQETYSCGTGTSAVVVAAVLTGVCDLNQEIEVLQKGGTLTAMYDGKNVFLTGTADITYKGCVEI